MQIEGGATFRSFIKDAPSEFRVHLDAYRGEARHRAEMRNIFDTTWVYLCHESEISKPFDYKSTMLGLRPVVVRRLEDGSIRGFLNVCPHRGTTLLREEKGNVRNLVCPYHGWSFNIAGKLIAVPDRARYPKSFDCAAHSLQSIARVESYQGFVFGCMQASGPSLLEHLGGVRRHLDRWLRRAAGYPIRVGMPHRYAFDGNWKFQSENVHDGYHPGFVHRSAFNAIRKLGSFQNRHLGAVRQQGLTRGYPQGHGVVEAGTPLESDFDPAMRQRYVDKLAALYGGEEAIEILNNCQFLIFPNLAVFDFNLRVIQPIAQDRTEVYSYPVLFEGMEQGVNSNRMLDAQTRVGTSGILSMDDVDIFCGNQSALAATDDLWLDLSRGQGMEEVLASGERIGAFSDETPQRAFWRRWQALMRSGLEQVDA